MKREIKLMRRVLEEIDHLANYFENAGFQEEEEALRLDSARAPWRT